MHSDKLDLKTVAQMEMNPYFNCLLMRVGQTKNGSFGFKMEQTEDSNSLIMAF